MFVVYIVEVWYLFDAGKETFCSIKLADLPIKSLGPKLPTKTIFDQQGWVEVL